MRKTLVAALIVTAVLGTGPAALACAALIGPGGNVVLSRTTTLAAYHAGLEHYVTSFEFRGSGGRFGSIVPLPAVPTKVERGGDWTLQRLRRETDPVPVAQAASARSSAESKDAEVLYETQIDALDITIVRGGGPQIAKWARQRGFVLAPGADEILSFYARRSPVFMTAAFNAKAAQERGQEFGQGTPIHLTMPTDNPWIPLRIFTLGLPKQEAVRADLYTLTENRPVTLFPGPGLLTERVTPASEPLLADLRSDKGMEWVPPKDMWLAHFVLDTPAEDLVYDLAIDATGAGRPSPVDAGLVLPPTPKPAPDATPKPTPEPTPAGTPAHATPHASALASAPASSSDDRDAFLLVGAIAIAVFLASAGIARFAFSRRA